MALLHGEVAVSLSVVNPIVGNTDLGGACYDPSTGEALYAVRNGGAFEVWRTTGGYRSLVLSSGSVEYLATIHAGPWLRPASAALQRIGGTLYAHLAGKNTTDLVAGNWLYRDTSTAQDGSGPWVLHGTITEAAFASTDTKHFMGGNAGGEILVLGGTWVANANYFSVPAANTTGTRQGVATSSDGGVTWSKRLDVGWYIMGGMYGQRWSRNFAKIDGGWYVGGSGDVDPGKHFKSTDGITWASIGDLGFGNSSGTSFPFYTPSRIYRFRGDYLSSGTVQSATAPPETLPTWVDAFTLAPMRFSGDVNSQAYPYVCNVGPARNPLWAVCGWGEILALDVAQGLHPCRQWPRADGLAASSARRRYPIDKSEQASPRSAGHYW